MEALPQLRRFLSDSSWYQPGQAARLFVVMCIPESLLPKEDVMGRTQVWRGKKQQHFSALMLSLLLDGVAMHKGHQMHVPKLVPVLRLISIKTNLPSFF